ncbi:hypothetical protein CARUB_v10007730mg, partial [Capsella rubella]
MKQRLIFSILCFGLISFRAASEIAQTCTSDQGTFRPNGTYDANRRLILASLPSNVTAQNGFLYNTSIGQEPNRVYGVGMCMPGSVQEDCSRCLKYASDWLIGSCPNQIAAYIWYIWSSDPKLCYVRYSNSSFSGSADLEPKYVVYFTADITSNLTEFKMIWEGLTLSMISATSASKNTPSSSNNHYKADVATFTKFQNIYAVMQCTPDSSNVDCDNCLRESVSDYQSCCGHKIGGYTMRPICFFRWQFYPFCNVFDNITILASPPPPTLEHPSLAVDQSNATKNAIVEIVVPIVVIFIIIIIVLVLLARRSAILCWRRKTYQEIGLDQSGMTNVRSIQFDLKTIEVATGKFARINKLGEGGFGEVFKGTLSNGIEVAVKRLSETSAQGAQEFKNEVVVAKLQHRNLVRLLGFCLEGEEKILVYEFVPNKSLDYFLF